MLALDVNDYACLLTLRGVIESIASMLAPTGVGGSVSLGLCVIFPKQLTL
jgi:hypothetical protein